MASAKLSSLANKEHNKSKQVIQRWTGINSSHKNQKTSSSNKGTLPHKISMKNNIHHVSQSAKKVSNQKISKERVCSRY